MFGTTSTWIAALVVFLTVITLDIGIAILRVIRWRRSGPSPREVTRAVLCLTRYMQQVQKSMTGTDHVAAITVYATDDANTNSPLKITLTEYPMAEPNHRESMYQQFLKYMTCKCGKRMEQSVVRRPFSDPQYPRETFQVIELLTCSCGETKERRTAIGH